MPRRNLAIPVAILFASLLPTSGNAQPDVASQILRNGDVEVRLRVEPTRTSTAGKIAMELEVTAPSSVTVEISEPAPSRGRLTTVAQTASGPMMVRPGVMEYRRRIVYRPFLGGKYEMPAFTVSCGGARIATKPVPVVITSVIRGDPITAAPAGILPAEAAPAAAPGSIVPWAIAAALVVVAVSGAWLACRRYRKPQPIPPALEPAAAALAAIESLPPQDLRGLERTIEAWRAGRDDLLQGVLGATYQWIRFGSPTPSEVEQFRESLRVCLRKQTRDHAAKEIR